jgi:hypothetical protein
MQKHAKQENFSNQYKQLFSVRKGNFYFLQVKSIHILQPTIHWKNLLNFKKNY